MDTNLRRANSLRRYQRRELITAAMAMLASVPKNMAARR
jgi:hypothetical protein